MRTIVQPEPPKGSLRFLYYTRFGGLALRLITRRWLSRLAGAFLDSRLSKPLIKRFIKKHGVCMEDYLPEKYPSFNAFFTRRIRPELRPFDRAPEAFVSPCDAALTVYSITDDLRFTVKGFDYTVETLLQNPALAERYRGGLCVVLRLTVNDYHRYFFCDDGEAGESAFIKGRLHTVQPAALGRRRVFTENCREYTVLHTRGFGAVTQVEVGAMMVGRIVNEKVANFSRGEEKGRFEFGGSTVILLLEAGKVVLDEEFFLNSAAEKETLVKCGEKIGIKG